MLNQVSLMGRLVSDPKPVTVHTVNGDVTKVLFCIANDEDYRKGDNKVVYFINCSAWRQTAEFIQRYFSKGQMIALTGKLITWEKSDEYANRNTVMEVQVQNAYFTSPKKHEDSQLTEYDDSQITPEDEDLPWD